MYIAVRWNQFSHFDCGDSQRPYIGLAIVLRLHDDLGGHPEWCADKSVFLVYALRKLRRNPKICELYLPQRIHHDVSSLNVPVNNFAFMKVSEAYE